VERVLTILGAKELVGMHLSDGKRQPAVRPFKDKVQGRGWNAPLHFEVEGVRPST
jgi:hypothetical protein